MNTLQSVQAAVSINNINAECEALRIQANEQIRMREVAREYININLFNMPAIATGTYVVHFIDERGEERQKDQEKNHALWLVTLQTTIEVGHTTYELLGNIFSQWAKETLKCDWKVEEAIKVATRFVEAMRDMGILNAKKESMEFHNETGKHTASVNKLHPDFLLKLAELREEMCEKTHMQCQPLRNQPLDWVDTNTGVAEFAGLRLIKGKVIKSNKVAPAVLSAVNKLQKVGFVIHPAMIDAAYDMVDNARTEGCTVEELRMYNELKNYEKGEFYFPVTMDTRGRMYYRGGLLTPQGTDFCKAAFQFAESMPLGEHGIDAICIHTANMLGMDKFSIEERIETVCELAAEGMFDGIKTIYDVTDNWPKANRFQALVAILEVQKMRKFQQDGFDVSTFESNLVCHQDGTCNGLQHMAAITKDLETARTVNCTESSTADTPLDIYQIIADEAQPHLIGKVKELVAKYGRDMSKNPVMITGYGAGEQTVIKNTAKYLAEHGENSAHAEAIGKAYIRALNEKAGAVRTMTDAVKGRMATALENGKTKFQWVTADGFVAATDYRDLEPQRIRAGVFNALVRSDKELALDLVKTEGAMCPNFVHSIDATHLRMVINGCNHNLVTVHDSIGSHAATYAATAKVIRQTFVEVHQYNAMDSLFNNLEVRVPKFKGEYHVEDAMFATYLFS